MVAMPESRIAAYADQYDAAQAELIRLVESLDDDQWRRTGANYPQRLNDEDEGRPVGVIAHHVAVSGPRIMARIRVAAEGGSQPPVANFRSGNAEHAQEFASVSQAEVAALLRETGESIARELRALPDGALEAVSETPIGPMTVAQRIERVLIGHVTTHTGSIRAALA